MILDNVETLISNQKFGAQEVYFGSNVPSAPSDGAMWFENPINGSSPYTQPWIWNSSNAVWLSNPFIIDYGSNVFSSSSFIEKSIPFYGVAANRILIRQLTGIITNQTSSAHSSTNNYTFAIRHTLGTDIPLPEVTTYNLLTNTGTVPSALSGLAARRVLENPNVWVPGNAWTLRLNAIKSGSPSNVYCHFALHVQLGRA